MPVHHIHMHPVAARRIDGADVLAKPRKVGGEDGGGDEDGAGGHGGSRKYEERCTDTPAGTGDPSRT